MESHLYNSLLIESRTRNYEPSKSIFFTEFDPAEINIFLARVESKVVSFKDSLRSLTNPSEKLKLASSIIVKLEKLLQHPILASSTNWLLEEHCTNSLELMAFRNN